MTIALKNRQLLESETPKIFSMNFNSNLIQRTDDVQECYR